MKYEIQEEYDLEKGLMFRAMFPEEVVDKKALYTVQNDMPDFLIPFKCRTIDGFMQCTYFVGVIRSFKIVWASAKSVST